MKITVPIIIIAVVAGIWFAKNWTEGSATGKNPSDNPAGITDANPDFDLNVTEEIDLNKLKSYGLPIVMILARLLYPLQRNGPGAERIKCGSARQSHCKIR
jgi:hypothetical protein